MTSITLNERALREALAESIPGILRPDAGAASLKVEPFHRSTFYATYIVTICTGSSPERRVFLKDFGVYARPKGASMERRRDRELRIYRDVLSSAELGTAAYYGSAWDAREPRFWLLLEYVDSTPLHDHRFDAWIEAARWLGRMHAPMAGLGLIRFGGRFSYAV